MVETSVEKVAAKLRAGGFQVQTAYSEDGKNYELRVSRGGQPKVKAFGPEASEIQVANGAVELMMAFHCEDIEALFGDDIRAATPEAVDPAPAADPVTA